MKTCANLGALTGATCIAMALCGCYTDVPNGPDTQVASTHVVIDVTQDAARTNPPAADRIGARLETYGYVRVTLELVNSTPKPFHFRYCDSAAVAFLEFELYQKGTRLLRDPTGVPPPIERYPPRRIEPGDSTLLPIRLGPWHDLQPGEYELRLRYDMYQGNVWELTPAHLEKRVLLSIKGSAAPPARLNSSGRNSEIAAAEMKRGKCRKECHAGMS